MTASHVDDRLPRKANVPSEVQSHIAEDYLRFAEHGLPAQWDRYLLDRYGIDLSTDYAGYALSNPFGKASGQLSMTLRQVQDDIAAGLGFVVLKTVIAVDEKGGQSMRDWAIRESRMVAERLTGAKGEVGWTISWKGRGWWQPFDDYLDLVRQARDAAAGTATLIVPSCKFHLPQPGEDHWRSEEYDFTVKRLLEAWQDGAGEPMPLEKDFSPTLAGSGRAAATENILSWLKAVPELVDRAAPNRVRLGLKLFNALFVDDFQLAMLRAIHQPDRSRPAFFIYGNRLFDPNREFDGHRGIAYGGPDLSDRNLRVMSQFQAEQSAAGQPMLPWSGTGNITTGKMALEYALRGARNFQLHTFFQLPADQYRMTIGSKVQKALLELNFHPESGLVVWMHDLANRLNLPTQPIRFSDVIGHGPVVER